MSKHQQANRSRRTVQTTVEWLSENVPHLSEADVAELGDMADREYLELFEDAGLLQDFGTLQEICQQGELLSTMAETGDMGLDPSDRSHIRPDTIVALSHDADGEGIYSGPGYYSSLRRAVAGELIVYLAAELGCGDEPSEEDLVCYERICRRLYAAILVHGRDGNTTEACTLVRRVLKGFTGSEMDAFCPLRDSIRRDGFPLDDPDAFQERFGKRVQAVDVDNPEEWHWIVDHLQEPYF